VQSFLQTLDGVADAHVAFSDRKARVLSSLSPDQLCVTLTELGMYAEVAQLVKTNDPRLPAAVGHSSHCTGFPSHPYTKEDAVALAESGTKTAAASPTTTPTVVNLAQPGALPTPAEKSACLLRIWVKGLPDQLFKRTWVAFNRCVSHRDQGHDMRRLCCYD